MARETHYVPAFTVFRGREAFSQRTVCGRYVRPSDHRNEPSCAECQRWLTQDAGEEARTAAGLGLVQVDGVWVPEEGVRR